MTNYKLTIFFPKPKTILKHKKLYNLIFNFNTTGWQYAWVRLVCKSADRVNTMQPVCIAFYFMCVSEIEEGDSSLQQTYNDDKSADALTLGEFARVLTEKA